MHLRTSVLSALGSAAFALLVGCATTQQQTPPDGSNTPPPGSEPVTTPSQPNPSSDASPWQRARVGDRVVYSYSANRAAPGGSEARTAGQLALEVVAVQQPWVWLKLSFNDVAARPMSPVLSRELVLPVRMDATRPLDVPREGTVSAEQLSAADRTWEAKRYIQDSRPADGPLTDRLYAVNPGPLYLTNGLLSASTTLSGFGAKGGSQLTLVQIQQGPEGAPAAAPPSMKHPLGPGTWSDVSINPGSGEELLRTCHSAERGYVLNASGPAPKTGGEPCPSFAEAEVTPLEEALLSLVSQSLDVSRWPPPSAAPASRNAFSAQGRAIPALTFETSESESGTRQLRSETYAEDPWSAPLDGLSVTARFGALAERVERVEAQGQRKPVYTKKLVGWGTWAGDTK